MKYKFLEESSSTFVVVKKKKKKNQNLQASGKGRYQSKAHHYATTKVHGLLLSLIICAALLPPQKESNVTERFRKSQQG